MEVQSRQTVGFKQWWVGGWRVVAEGGCLLSEDYGKREGQER